MYPIFSVWACKAPPAKMKIIVATRNGVRRIIPAPFDVMLIGRISLFPHGVNYASLLVLSRLLVPLPE